MSVLVDQVEPSAFEASAFPRHRSVIGLEQARLIHVTLVVCVQRQQVSPVSGHNIRMTPLLRVRAFFLQQSFICDSEALPMNAANKYGFPRMHVLCYRFLIIKLNNTYCRICTIYLKLKTPRIASVVLHFTKKKKGAPDWK